MTVHLLIGELIGEETSSVKELKKGGFELIAVCLCLHRHRATHFLTEEAVNSK